MYPTKETLENFLNPIQHIVFDCDGVLYASQNFFEHVPELLNYLSQSKKLYFMTNNSRKSRIEYKKKFIQMGLNPNVITDIFSSSYAAALYMKSIWNSLPWSNDSREKKVFVIGMEGINEELKLQGIESIGYEFSNKIELNEDEILNTFSNYQKMYDIKCVLVGYDSYFNMYKLAFASLCLREIPGCKYIVTNTDVGLPWKNSLLPGSGTIVASLNIAVNREPDMICGKPNTFLLDHLAETHNVDRTSVLMVGDRLETDIRMANKASIKSMAVLSGAASKKDIENAQHIDKPSIVVKGLTHVFKTIAEIQ